MIKVYSLSPFAAAGIRWIASDTGTVPDLSICSSSCSCCICSSSSSKSISSIGSPRLVLVIALEISSLSWLCSCNLLLSFPINSVHGYGRQMYTYIVSSTFSGVSFPCICFMASPALSMAARVSRLILADSMALICCSRVPICDIVCSRLCSCAFFLRSAALAANRIGYQFPAHQMRMHRAAVGGERYLPFLFVLTFFRAIASCSSICVIKCFSRFCSMSNCPLKPRIAFLGLSFFFWAPPPPNQPQTPDMMIKIVFW